MKSNESQALHAGIDSDRAERAVDLAAGTKPVEEHEDEEAIAEPAAIFSP